MNLAMNPNNEPGTGPGALPRRGFLTSAAGAAVLPIAVNASDEKPAPDKGARKKTFLAVEGHLDDAEIGAGGVLIQAARAGHRVVIVTVASDYTSWAETIGREDRVKREQVELAKAFGFEKRFLGGKYHQTDASDLALKRPIWEVCVEL